MIHYHGTPVGGTRKDAARFLSGRHALVPFKRQDDLGVALEVCQSIVLDNSAFSYWKSGQGKVPFFEYHAWVQSLAGHPALDWCLIPDKIDGDEQDNVELVTRWLKSGSKVESVPVWHLHESIDWLVYLAKRFYRVALGSSGQWATPGNESWWRRINEAMAAITVNGKPMCKLHGLRMLDPQIFTRLPIASADSTNASVNSGSISRFGAYVPPTAGQRSEIIASRIEAHQSAPIWEPNPQHDLFGNITGDLT